MTSTTPTKTWQQAMSSVVWLSLKNRTESRYTELSHEDYDANKGSREQRERFHKAWTRSVEELLYRLRSAKTRRLFSAGFTQMLCAQPQYELRIHFDEISERLLSEDGWEDLRDILMLSLSARSYLTPATREDK